MEDFAAFLLALFSSVSGELPERCQEAFHSDALASQCFGSDGGSANCF